MRSTTGRSGLTEMIGDHHARADWTRLRKALVGDLLRAGHPDYEAVRRPAIANFAELRPEGVVRCSGPEDAAAALAFATDNGLPVAVRSGGHCFAGRSSTCGLLIDVTAMNRIQIDGPRVRIGAGARLGQVYEQLAARGLTIPAGCGPTVGIAGLTLGGGLGITGRQHGLTSDRLVGAEVVLPDGRQVTCAASEHPDLLWLLRGGGCPGVVTALDFAAVPALPLTGFHLQWAEPAAPAAVEAWQEWAPDAQIEMAASLVISAAGDPHRPALVNLFGAFTGAKADCVASLAGFRDLLGVEPDTAAYHHGALPDVKRYLNSVDVHGTGVDDTSAFLYSRSEFFARRLPAATVRELVGALTAHRSPDEKRDLDFSPWGGAYARMPADATAFVHRDARFLLKHGLSVPPQHEDPARRWLRDSWELSHPWGTGGSYQNFPDPDLLSPIRAYYGTNAERVLQTRQRYASTEPSRS